MQKYRKLNSLAGILVSLPLLIVATPGLTQQNTGLNFIFEISGNIQIKRDGRGSYKPVYIGTLLKSSDQLRLEKGASVEVFCDNLTTGKINSQGEFLVSRVCPFTKSPIIKRSNVDRDQPRSLTRAPNELEIPYIISPRDTAILSDELILRWNKVKGATSYQVVLRGPGVDWTTQVKQSEVVYSGKDSLQPGSYYWVIVTADNGLSSESGTSTGFRLLSQQDAKRVKAEITQLQKLGLTDESKTLALAHLYNSNNLNAAAIDLLAESVKKGNKTTAVYQLLGSLYQQVGLNQLAKEQYVTALKLAQVQKNLEAQAIIQASLGEIEIALNNLRQAFELLQAAQRSYRALGDEQQAQELQQIIDYLKTI
jgi:hypothetical protein